LDSELSFVLFFFVDVEPFAGHVFGVVSEMYCSLLSQNVTMQVLGHHVPDGCNVADNPSRVESVKPGVIQDPMTRIAVACLVNAVSEQLAQLALQVQSPAVRERTILVNQAPAASPAARDAANPMYLPASPAATPAHVANPMYQPANQAASHVANPMYQQPANPDASA